jgi:glycosyltransferase involved in cell wall biosynthesis
MTTSNDPMTRRPPVTLLLPNRNNEPVLDLVLERLIEHTTYPNYELIVVDDGSTDGSLDILRRWRDAGNFSEFTLLEREHGGVVAALNAGLAAASGELVVQLDGDATVETSEWLESMVDFYECDAQIGVVCPLVVFDHGRVHAAGVNMICREGLHDRGTRPIEPAGQRTFNSRVKRMTREEAGRTVTEASEVDASIGVCMLFSRAMAETLGGYDHNFSPVWFDDIDLSLSARRLGSKVFFVPDVEFVHRRDRTPLPSSRAGRIRKRARQAVASVTPETVRSSVRRAEGRRPPRHPPDKLRRLEHHYAYWREKWGFDLINPDLEQVLDRYGDTEVCWAHDETRRAAGERIAAAWKARPLGAAASAVN